jgi:hypothetical protein
MPPGAGNDFERNIGSGDKYGAADYTDWRPFTAIFGDARDRRIAKLGKKLSARYLGVARRAVIPLVAFR